MNTLLLLFLALPIATIILSIVLLKILKCPALVAATFFAIYLILTYAIFGSDFLIFAIIYTILSYITAIITRIICNIIERINRCSNLRMGENCKHNNDCCDNICNCTNSSNTIATTSNTTTNSNSNFPRAQFTVTTNQANPVLFLGNRNTTSGRQNCCSCRRR